jgi:predicted neuraminidase
MLSFSLIGALAAVMPTGVQAEMRGELIFPPEKLHNHGSCIVECPNGDLLACWYRGSGERTADDVVVLGARMTRASGKWSEPFLMADTPGLPDCNPCMVIDPQKRLWLLWPVILDGHWESALMKYKVSSDYTRKPGSPVWETEKVMHLKPGPEFARKAKLSAYLEKVQARANTPLDVRLGWMTRVHPFILDGKRMIVPLYSDGFDFSLMAYTDDGGETWKTSEPLVGAGNVQPSIVRRKDGALVAFYRDNGPPPKRVMVSESTDGGQTWTLSRDIDLPNPGSGLEAVVLKSGRWLLVCNDTERGRNSLGIYVSEDEGRTWSRLRHLEQDKAGKGAGSYSYPSIMQARDGAIHVTYSYSTSAQNAKEGKGESIKHVRLTEQWLLNGNDLK